MSLEQLMNEPVMSVSKRETRIGDSPAAVTVITQEDLRRLGITTLPEALRLVPGMDVARIAPDQWAISARGFNSEFANKLLVLIDGRTVYSPAGGGVIWSSQDVILEDVDRIEVIRGPGAALWGANAVNGVINVITKSSRDTQGVLLSGGVGTEDQPMLTARYGGQSGDDLSWRVFAQYFDREAFADWEKDDREGQWHTAHGGFRMDWKSSPRDDFTLQGDVYDADAAKAIDRINLTTLGVSTAETENENDGANILARWTRTLASGAFTVQTYFDHVDQGEGYGVEHRETFDLELQHHLALGARQDVVWGAGYRHTGIVEGPSAEIIWSPQRIGIDLVNLFLQDEITVFPDRLRATLGSKFEHNDLSGWFIDPKVQLLWTPSANLSVWGAISRSSRTPSMFELYGTFSLTAFVPAPGSPQELVAILPNARLRSEQMLTYELGYRLQPSSRVSVDLTIYLSNYGQVIAQEPVGTVYSAIPGAPHLMLGFMEENADNEKTYGVESTVNWQVLPAWKLMASYSWLHMVAPWDTFIVRESPANQFQIRSYADLTPHLELNSALYYVEALDAQQGPALTHIPAYVRADTGVIWKLDKSLSIGLWGQNLLQGRHLEFASQSASTLVPVPRSWLAKITWTF